MKLLISKFPSTIPYLQWKGEGYKPILTKDYMDEFRNRAEDKDHLFNKIVLIFGVIHACRRQELVTLLTTNIVDYKTHFLVKLEDTKTKIDRSFIIVSGKFEYVILLELVRRYIALRPTWRSILEK